MLDKRYCNCKKCAIHASLDNLLLLVGSDSTVVMQRPHFLITDTGPSPYVIALKRSVHVGTVTQVDCVEELMRVVTKHHKVLDLLILDILISPASVQQQSQFPRCTLDGLDALDTLSMHWPKLPVAMLSRFYNDKNVTSAYRRGAVWFGQRRYGSTRDFAHTMVRLSGGDQVMPRGYSPLMENKIRALRDPLLKLGFDADIELLSLLLAHKNADEIARIMQWANRQMTYNRLSQFIQTTGLADRDALLAHARAVGLIALPSLATTPA